MSVCLRGKEKKKGVKNTKQGAAREMWWQQYDVMEAGKGEGCTIILTARPSG